MQMAIHVEGRDCPEMQAQNLFTDDLTSDLDEEELSELLTSQVEEDKVKRQEEKDKRKKMKEEKKKKKKNKISYSYTEDL